AIIVGVVSLILFVWRQLLSKEPMLDMRSFKFPMFSLTTIMLIIVMMALFSSMLIIPLYLQGVLALTAFAAGLALLPGGILNGFLAPVTGKLFDKFGPRVLVVPGSLIVSIVMWLFSTVSTTTTVTTFVVLHCFLM